MEEVLGADMVRVVVAGATGMVGRELIRQLDLRPEAEVTALVRKPGRLRALSGRVNEVAFDFEAPASYERLGAEIPCDVFLCALGTTIAAAGSPEAFRRVDLEYPRRFAERLARMDSRPLLGVVSSVGAGDPKGLYLQTKAEMEKAVLASGLPCVIARPSLLLGQRREFRLGERVAQLLSKPYLFFAKLLAPQTRWIWKYAPIEACAVAHALILTCLDEPAATTHTSSARILEGIKLHHPIFSIGGE